MARARARTAKRTPRPTKLPAPPPASRPPPLAIAAATLLVAACVIPMLLWGNPYPDHVLPYWSLGGALVVATLLAATFAPQGLALLSDRCGRALIAPSPAAFAAIIAATTVVLSLVLSSYSFDRFPTTSDEIAQLWHAQMLVHGRLALPPDANPEFFAFENVIDRGRWYSQFPIGGPLSLAAGVLVGVPWLVNPLLAGVAAAAIYQFARQAYGEMQGRAIAALFGVTPLVLMMAGTYMNHLPVLCLAACALAVLPAWERATRRRDALAFATIIGLALGAIVTIRPLDGVVAASAIGIFQLVVVWRNPARAPELLVQTLAAAVAVAPLLYANHATTGAALRFGYDVIWGQGHRVGFHADPLGDVHTPARAVEYATTYVNALNVFLMAWPVPALFVAIAALLVMRRTTRWDALLLGFFAAQVAAYAAYWGIGDFLGPRFLFTALPTIIVLLARTPFLVGERFGVRWRDAVVAFTLACIVVSWAAPYTVNSASGLATQVHNTRRVLKVDVAGAVHDADLHHALVFLRDPFDGRLSRRLWGVGVTRSDAAQLLATSDACSLLSAVAVAEHDTVSASAERTATVRRTSVAFTPNDAAVRTWNPAIRISSEASITPDCRAELDADARLGNAPFGPSLALERIDASGHLGGDVIYAADLGDHNAALRTRFGDRSWHRLSITRSPDGRLRAVISPY